MAQVVNLVGKRFGNLVVLERTDNYVSPNGVTLVRWRCRCDCGNEVVAIGSNLKWGYTHHCGCRSKFTTPTKDSHKRKKTTSLIGRRFGYLLVTEELQPYYSKSGIVNRRYRCICDCGKSRDVYRSQLVSGSVYSCGCIQPHEYKRIISFLRKDREQSC